MDHENLTPGDRSSVPVLSKSVREWMVERFALWLDEAFATEPGLQGLPSEILGEMRREDQEGAPETQGPSPDLYQLWASMTRLAQEVKLQGRSFKDLSGTLAPLPELSCRIEDESRAHARALDVALRAVDEAREARGKTADQVRLEARRGAQRELMDALLDVRDRLARGLVVARQVACPPVLPAGRGWLARLSRWLDSHAPQPEPGPAIRALENGYRLGLERLSETLDRLGLREIECQDHPFDPHRMSAVEVMPCSEAAQDGTVVEVCRAGFTWNGEVYRPAQVKVARVARGARGAPFAGASSPAGE